MSWGIFKSNMKGYMSNPIGVASLEVFAKKLTVECVSVEVFKD